MSTPENLWHFMRLVIIAIAVLPASARGVAPLDPRAAPLIGVDVTPSRRLHLHAPARHHCQARRPLLGREDAREELQHQVVLDVGECV